jgi:hypothetical protein
VLILLYILSQNCRNASKKWLLCAKSLKSPLSCCYTAIKLLRIIKMSNKNQNQLPDDDITAGDPGIGVLYGKLIERSKGPIDRAESVYQLAKMGIADRVTLDFVKHPFRDGVASAIAIGGLGAVTGAAVIAARRH